MKPKFINIIDKEQREWFEKIALQIVKERDESATKVVSQFKEANAQLASRILIIFRSILHDCLKMEKIVIKDNVVQSSDMKSRLIIMPMAQVAIVQFLYEYAIKPFKHELSKEDIEHCTIVEQALKFDNNEGVDLTTQLNAMLQVCIIAKENNTPAEFRFVDTPPASENEAQA